MITELHRPGPAGAVLTGISERADVPVFARGTVGGVRYHALAVDRITGIDLAWTEAVRTPGDAPQLTTLGVRAGDLLRSAGTLIPILVTESGAAVDVSEAFVSEGFAPGHILRTDDLA